ncbi:unnamed protein product [Trifolium pratense]|uniref:Uncharacterized protein n=1 Tax=Trifolium pratense TaxID=57577 RepID=A0ACB0JDS2_TRIPR|nr:unnamed protein product [Trifolium pratense]
MEISVWENYLYPAQHLVFNAFDTTPFHSVKVAILSLAIEKNEVLISESLFKRGEKELLTNSRCSLQSKQDRRRVKAILLKRVFQKPTFGPSVYCAWKPEWDSLLQESRARLHARQGVRYISLEGLDIVNMKTSMQPVPADGKTVGEIVMHGNAMMKPYLKNPKAIEKSFANGWYHSGDLAVKHPDGCIEIRECSVLASCNTQGIRGCKAE